MEDEDESTEVTWGEFKKQVEVTGITDEMHVSYIDWDDGHDVSVRIWPDGKGFRVE